jgi:hypothetical protein
MPIKIADTNVLQHDPTLLTEYLAASQSNKVAIPEEVMIEKHKGNAALSITRSFEQARRYPNQIVILRGLPSIYGWSICSAAGARHLIDLKQTKHFAEWYDAIVNEPNASDVKEHLASRARQAREQMNEIGKSVEHMLPIFEKINGDFDSGEVTELRKRKSYGRTTQIKLMDIMYRISRALFKHAGVPQNRQPSLVSDAPHYFIFRYAMCMTLLYTRWVNAGTWSEKRERLVNDVIDMHIAALGTFYGGVLSADERLVGVHLEARFMLRSIRGFVG